MGLDMSLCGEEYEYGNYNQPYPRKSGTLYTLGYWRKHPNLHGYIVENFADGVDECQRIPLSTEDIEQIIAAVSCENLPVTEGFFFGKSESAGEQDTLAQLKLALKWIHEGTAMKDVYRSVYYQASW